jgi:hypothetical protein
MNGLDKELHALDLYLTTCEKKEFLLEGVWLAFKYKEKNPSWDVLKCFETAIWDWLLSESKKESASDLKSTIKKINEIKERRKAK